MTSTSFFRRVPWRTIGWAVHAVVRVVICVLVLPYAAAKVILLQMGLVDYPGLLITLGEKSPMGLLWTFMAFSPWMQFLAGAVELLAAALVLWRRTAWLGGLIGAVSLGVVWLLNMTFDVPVKQFAFAQMVLFLIVLAPWVPRLVAFALGRAVPEMHYPRLIPWPRAHRLTRWLPPVAAAGMLIAGLAAPAILVPKQFPTVHEDLAGVWQVAHDSSQPAPQLLDDARLSTLALGKRSVGGAPALKGLEGDPGEFAGASVRRANGDLQAGFYRVDDSKPGQPRLDLYLLAPMAADEQNFGAGEEFADEYHLRYQVVDGQLLLDDDAHQLTLRPSETGTLLLDRGFRWQGSPLNR